MNRDRFPRLVALLAVVALLLACGCSGARVKSQEDPRLPKLRAMGYRIAVVPFATSAPEEGFLAASLGPVGEALALEGGSGLPERTALGAWLRRDVVTWLSQSEFEVIDPWSSDTQLAHAGFDATSMRDPTRAAEIARVLQVDGVLFGEVTRWNRSYYVVQSTAEVGLALQLLDRDGSTLFSTERTETIGSGITGGPTGYSSALSAPVQGLSGNTLRELTRSVARNAAFDLGGNTPQASESPLAPRLSVVSLVRADDSAFGFEETIHVMAIGTPGCDVRFDLGRLRVGIPMQQTSVIPDPRGDRAVYEGRYVVQPETADGYFPLFVTIARQGAHAKRSRYRWDGELRIEADKSKKPFKHFQF